MNRLALKQLRAICLMAISLFMAGGCVRSIQPILKDDQVITNDQLLGNWVSSDGKTSGVVTATDDHKGYKLLYTDEKDKQANLLIRLGKIGDMTIAESSIDDPAPDASDVYKMHLMPLHSFMVVKQVTSQQLILKLMDSDWLSKYVKAHPDELATVRVDDNDVLISATTDDFQAFLLRHAKDDGVFGSDGVFVRPGDPTSRATTAPASDAPHVP
jgi:uncharacterized protein YcfL